MSGLRNWLRRLFLGGIGHAVHRHIRSMARARADGHMLSARFHAARLQRKYGLFINPNATFTETLRLPHPVGVVIGDGVKLGERVSVYQHVTLGGARIGDWKSGKYPEIGDDTVIFAGAVVVGAVRVGRNCVVGANSVVTRDVPDNATVAGVPAQVLKINPPASEGTS